MTSPPFPHVAYEDPRVAARVVAGRELRYDAGPDPAQDRPAHVRAGSGLTWARTSGGERLVVVQDDASFLALVDPRGGSVLDVALPPGPGGARQFDDLRGTKRLKLDLEACLTLDDGGEQVVLGIGSGSTRQRERIVVVRGLAATPRVELVDAAALYAAMRAMSAFAGSELNVEGATCDGGDVVLFQRGNGAPLGADGDRVPIDATARVDQAALLAHLRDPAVAPPPLRDVRPWRVGRLDGVRLTFTDAATGSDGRLWFLAAAEDSPDTYRDGPVAGVVLGVIERARGVTWGRWARITRDDRPWVAKAEGLALDPDDPARAWVVVDRDDPTAAAELCEVRLDGAWGPAPTRPHGVVRVVSGGQTGADRAALDAALALGLPHGGWCPRGRLAEDGRIDERYALVETGSADPGERTRANVALADATVVVTRGPAQGGSALTIAVARELGRPLLHVDLAREDARAGEVVRCWLERVQPATLNVAGARESEAPGLRARVQELLRVALS